MRGIYSINLFSPSKTTFIAPGPFTHNGDGTGGSAPQVQSYVAVNGESNAEIGFGPHAADGILLKDSGMVAVGVAAPGENQATEILHGYVARVGLGHKNSSLYIFSFIFNFFFV